MRAAAMSCIQSVSIHSSCLCGLRLTVTAAAGTLIERTVHKRNQHAIFFLDCADLALTLVYLMQTNTSKNNQTDRMQSHNKDHRLQLTSRCDSSNKRACALFSVNLGERLDNIIAPRRRFLQLNARLDNICQSPMSNVSQWRV